MNTKVINVFKDNMDTFFKILVYCLDRAVNQLILSDMTSEKISQPKTNSLYPFNAYNY